MENTKQDTFIVEDEIFNVTADSPYHECFKCRSFCKECKGPNPLALGVEGACDFLQQTRIFLGKSYQDVADGTGISLATVKRTLTKKVEPNLYTVVKINNYFFDNADGALRPCAIPNVAPNPNEDKLNDALRELERSLSDNDEYRAALDNIHVSYKAELQAIREDAEKEKQTIREDAQRQINHLLNELARARAEADAWRYENDRKGKLIDKYLDKMIAK